MKKHKSLTPLEKQILYMALIKDIANDKFPTEKHKDIANHLVKWLVNENLGWGEIPPKANAQKTPEQKKLRDEIENWDLQEKSRVITSLDKS